MRKYFLLLTILIACSIFTQCAKKEIDNKAEPGTGSINNSPPDDFSVRIDSVTDNSVNLIWDAAKDKDGDSIYYSIYLNNRLIANHIPERSYKIQKLSELTDYEGKVVATDSKSTSSNAAFSFKTSKYYLRFLKRFNYEYGGYYGASNVYSMIKANDNGYIITGRSGRLDGLDPTQLFALKIDSSGNEIWKRFYPGYSLPNDRGTQFKATATQNGYIVLSQYHVIKLDNQGNIRWATKIECDETSSVKTDQDGNIYMAGIQASTTTGILSEGLLVKLDQAGHVLYNKTYHSSIPGTSYNEFFDLQVSPSNDIVILGRTEYYFWLIKVDNNGKLLFQKIYSKGIPSTYPTSSTDEYAFPEQIIATEDGSYLLSGSLFGMFGTFHRTLIKVTTRGDIIWETREEAGSSRISWIIETPDNGFIATGSNELLYSSQWALFKYDKNGRTQWEKSYDETFAYLRGRAIIATADGGYMIAGEFNKAYLDPGEEAQILVFKTDPTGYFGW